MCSRPFALLAALLLAGCGAAEPMPVRPAIWKIDGPAGERGWLIGTIHALPSPPALASPAFDRVRREAGTLVVEVAGESAEQMADTFRRLGTAERAVPLTDRAAPADRAALAALLRRLDVAPADLDRLDTWAAALTLSQRLTASAGASDHGADRAIIRAMQGKPVRQLEGATAQLAIFDTLPESEQRDLLSATLRSAADPSAETARLARAWSRGDADALGGLDRTGLLADPELREALLVKRNRAWLGVLEPMLRRGERPLVAVGALHVVGQDGLAAQLAGNGYKVARIQ